MANLDLKCFWQDWSNTRGHGFLISSTKNIEWNHWVFSFTCGIKCKGVISPTLLEIEQFGFVGTVPPAFGFCWWSIYFGRNACMLNKIIATCLKSALWFKGCIYCKKHRWQFGPWAWIPLCTLPVVVFSQKLCGGTTRHFPNFGKKSTPIGHGVGFARTKIIRHKRPTQTMENVSNTASRTTAELAQDLHPQVDALAASNFYFLFVSCEYLLTGQMASRHYRVDALTSGHVNYLNSPHRPEDRQQKRSERLYLFSSRHSSMKHWDLALFYRTHFAMHNSKDVGPKHGPNSLNQAGNNKRQPGAPPFDWRSPVIFCNHRQDWKMSYNSWSANYAIVGYFPNIPPPPWRSHAKNRNPPEMHSAKFTHPTFRSIFLNHNFADSPFPPPEIYMSCLVSARPEAPMYVTYTNIRSANIGVYKAQAVKKWLDSIWHSCSLPNGFRKPSESSPKTFRKPSESLPKALRKPVVFFHCQLDKYLFCRASPFLPIFCSIWMGENTISVYQNNSFKHLPANVLHCLQHFPQFESECAANGESVWTSQAVRGDGDS